MATCSLLYNYNGMQQMASNNTHNSHSGFQLNEEIEAVKSNTAIIANHQSSAFFSSESNAWYQPNSDSQYHLTNHNELQNFQQTIQTNDPNYHFADHSHFNNLPDDPLNHSYYTFPSDNHQMSTIQTSNCLLQRQQTPNYNFLNVQENLQLNTQTEDDTEYNLHHLNKQYNGHLQTFDNGTQVSSHPVQNPLEKHLQVYQQNPQEENHTLKKFKEHSQALQWNPDMQPQYTSNITTVNKKSGRCRCTNCQVDILYNFKKPSSKMKEKREHVCHIPGCNKVYHKTSHLKAHIRWHNGERPFHCPWLLCGKSFIRSDELRRHFRSHTGEKQFVCTICNKRFTRSDHLSKHSQVHGLTQPAKRRRKENKNQ